ncbi:MAG: hypothetical protein V1858_00195 [Candidatus Gottesmanbacteria bacterium]
MIIREIKCKSAIGKCGFPGGGLAINPYVGCSHSCVYCYARFKRGASLAATKPRSRRGETAAY